MKRRDLKIIWSSNSVFSNSGYGSFSRDLLCRMLEDGWNVGHIAWWGQEGSDVVYDMGQVNKRFAGLKLKAYPKMDDPFGTDALVHQGKDFGADVTFVMQDVWTLNPQYLPQVKNLIYYFPVDKDPAPLNIIQRLPYAHRLITFSQFGHDTLAKSGWASNLILEGVDTTQFQPMDKQQARAKLGLPQDAFIFGMIAANKENPPRKGWEEALLGFAKFYKTHPTALLYIKVQQRSPTGFPIESFARYLNIAHRLVFADNYISVFKGGPPYISVDMNAIDVLLHPSQTEGFGLTPVEAMACGTPAIVGDNTSQPELIIEGKTGWKARCKDTRYTADDSFVYKVDPDDLCLQMEKAYKTLQSKNTVSKACREHVVKKYNIDTIFKQKWVPYLEKLQVNILGEKSNNNPQKSQ